MNTRKGSSIAESMFCPKAGEALNWLLLFDWVFETQQKLLFRTEQITIFQGSICRLADSGSAWDVESRWLKRNSLRVIYFAPQPKTTIKFLISIEPARTNCYLASSLATATAQLQPITNDKRKIFYLWSHLNVHCICRTVTSHPPLPGGRVAIVFRGVHKSRSHGDYEVILVTLRNQGWIERL